MDKPGAPDRQAGGRILDRIIHRRYAIGYPIRDVSGAQGDGTVPDQVAETDRPGRSRPMRARVGASEEQSDVVVEPVASVDETQQAVGGSRQVGDGGQVDGVGQGVQQTLAAVADADRGGFDEPVGVQREGGAGREPAAGFGELLVADAEHDAVGVTDEFDGSVGVAQRWGEMTGVGKGHGLGGGAQTAAHYVPDDQGYPAGGQHDDVEPVAVRFGADGAGLIAPCQFQALHGRDVSGQQSALQR